MSPAAREVTLTITNQAGLHARACQLFVNLAGRFRADVFVRRDDVEVNGKSILGVMMLAAETGATIVVRADGPDAEEALQALTRLVEDKFGED
ncbi:MAG: HPr family phosphocarrier protein [Candidatus Eiseniibacteriota bacterium]